MPRVQIMKEVSPANVSKVTQVMVQIVKVSRQKYLLSYWLILQQQFQMHQFLIFQNF
jgi:hypothetical protein